MTAPFVATVTKPPSGGVVGRSRLQRALLVAALLLPLLMAIALLAWMAVPRAGAGQGRTSWMDRLFGGTDGEGLTRIQSEETICSLPKKIGPCRGAMPRFFYSTDSGVCQSFLYGGCDGNANNFETIEECTSHCGIQTSAAGGRKSTQRADCSLPKKIGPCRGVLPRFFYSTESGVCQSFLYGGCDGNANNFETIEECTSHCGVQPTGSETHEGQDKEGGAAICTLPKVVGDCRAAMPRYYFDVKTSACQEFTYGGCGGNGNNFETLHDCEKMCSSAKSGSTGESDCSSEPDGGICMAYMERYAFHPATRSCEKFVYGGCGGNGNRYSSKEECEEHCAAGGDREKPTELVEGTDYDTTLCGMAECPMDCGVVGRRDGCLLCQCGHTPFTDPDEVAVPADKPCPPGYSLNRHDHGASVCTPDMAEPVPAE